MRDPDAAAVALALANSALVTLTGGHIYGGDAVPREVVFDESTDSAVCLKSRGGQPEYTNMATVSIQAKCYGPTHPEAWACYQTLHTALHEQSSAAVTNCLAESTGQALTEPSTGRAFVLAYFQLFIRPASG